MGRLSYYLLLLFYFCIIFGLFVPQILSTESPGQSTTSKSPSGQPGPVPANTSADDDEDNSGLAWYWWMMIVLFALSCICCSFIIFCCCCGAGAAAGAVSKKSSSKKKKSSSSHHRKSSKHSKKKWSFRYWIFKFKTFLKAFFGHSNFINFLLCLHEFDFKLKVNLTEFYSFNFWCYISKETRAQIQKIKNDFTKLKFVKHWKQINLSLDQVINKNCSKNANKQCGKMGVVLLTSWPHQ